MTKVGAEQNVFTDCARRRRGDSALDGGSIPPSSTDRCHKNERPASLVKTGAAGLLCVVDESSRDEVCSHFAHIRCARTLIWAGWGSFVILRSSELAETIRQPRSIPRAL